MKKVLMIMTMFAAVAFTTNSAKAQDLPDFDIAVGNLVNIKIGDIIIQDITIQDVVDIDIKNVLNENDIDITVVLNILSNTTNDELLTNLLRAAGLITGDLVVVGVLLDEVTGEVDQVLVESKKLLK